MNNNKQSERRSAESMLVDRRSKTRRESEFNAVFFVVGTGKIHPNRRREQRRLGDDRRVAI